jgi:hypothetical protein
VITAAHAGYSAADLHIHTRFSDGQPSPRAVLDHVKAAGHPDLIAITDHNTIAGALQAADLAPEFGITVIVGEEVSSVGGHILGLFLQERVPPGMSPQATLAAIHAQGGIAVAPHPFYQARRPRRSLELPTMESVGKLAAALPFDAIEVVNGTPFLGRANLRARSFNQAQIGRAETGASDAHILAAIGKGYTLFPGETAADLRRALLMGSTAARLRSYHWGELLHYAHFWLRLSLARRAPAW